MSPKNKKTQNEEIVAFLKTRNQKRKQEDDILIPDTPAKKTKTPAKRSLKKNTKELIIKALNDEGAIIEALNDIDNGKIQKLTPAAKRGQKKKEPIIEALNNGDNENNEVHGDDECIDGNDSEDDDNIIDYDDIEDDDDNE
ncbi:13603_t:CDS:2, partial [Funneliformis geosporum]